MSGTLTDLTNAQIRSNVKQLYGLVVSRPALQVTDGKATMYACDVNVGISDPTGLIDQTTQYLTGVPGTSGYTANDSLTIGTILRDVPIASNNQNLMYADVGNPVILERSASGQWQVTGFSIEQPGTHLRYAVDLGTGEIPSVIDKSVSGRVLTLGELGTIGGGFGVCPLGASGIFLAGNLVEVVG